MKERFPHEIETLVSVVITSYNYGCCLRDSIQSVLDGLDLEALPLSEVIENISSFLEKNSLVPPPYNKAETISVFIIKLYHEKI